MLNVRNFLSAFCKLFSFECFLNAPIFISTETSSYAHLYAYPNINSVKRVDSTKFLSCFISSKLSRPTHIENVALKMCKGITMVRVV